MVEQTIRQGWNLRYVNALALAIVVGLIVRLHFVLNSDFPLNDGGLFYTMVRDLQRSHYTLPQYSSYNLSGIPFAYPPLALYLCALVDDLTPLTLFDVFRFLPLVLNMLGAVAFHRFSLSVLPSRIASVIATFSFVLLPEGFRWQIMGGGVTRSLGLLFAILLLHETYSMYAHNDRARVGGAAVLAGAVVLSHPETAWFAAVSATTLFVAKGRNREGVKNSMSVALGALVISAPWLATVLTWHGPSPFVSAISGNQRAWPAYGSALSLLLLKVTDEPIFPILGALGILGILASLIRGRLLLPAWLVVVFVLVSRSTHTFASVPLSLLVGSGAAEVLLPSLQQIHLNRCQRAAAATTAPLEKLGIGKVPFARFGLPGWVLACTLLYSVFSTVSFGYLWRLDGLRREDREAMGWIATATPASSIFVVVPTNDWGFDSVSEWFPALTERRSASTVQGYEWVGTDAFARRIAQHRALVACANLDAGCLEDWAADVALPLTHVYVTATPVARANARSSAQSSLRQSLLAAPGYRVVYDRGGVTVFAIGPDVR